MTSFADLILIIGVVYTVRRNGALIASLGLLAKVSILAILLALFVRTFLLGAVEVESASMVPALLPGDHVLVDRQAYQPPGAWAWVLPSGRPERGDVVVVQRPGGKVLVKRVVALPGDIVEVVDGRLWVNGEASGDRWRSSARERLHPHRLRSQEIFVMGDQRSESRDSRHWGPARVEWLRGRAVLIYWSRTPAVSAGDWDKIDSSAWRRVAATRWHRWLQPVR